MHLTGNERVLTYQNNILELSSKSRSTEAGTQEWVAIIVMDLIIYPFSISKCQYQCLHLRVYFKWRIYNH